MLIYVHGDDREKVSSHFFGGAERNLSWAHGEAKRWLGETGNGRVTGGVSLVDTDLPHHSRVSLRVRLTGSIPVARFQSQNVIAAEPLTIE
jgi:hypothetical protein